MNEIILQAFETQLPADGSLWRTIAEKADEFASMGISALWIPSPCKGASGSNSNGYDLYDLYDLGEFDQKGSVRTKYGTKAELHDMIRRLHEKGVSVYADIVLNHKTGADGKEAWIPVVEVDQNDRNREINRPRKEFLWTLFDFPGRRGRYSSFHWNHTHFTGCEESTDGYSKIFWIFWRRNSEENHPRIFRFPEKHWAEDVDHENGNYDYLLGCDIDHGNPEVRDELIRWGKWFLDETHVDGFRLDAVKHISAAFYRHWLPDMRSHAGKNLFAVGEYVSGDVGRLESYLGNVGFVMSLFDFPLHYLFHEASGTDESENHGFDLRRLFSETLVSRQPDHAVTFVDNHDTQNDGGMLTSPVHWRFQVAAYAIILLRKLGVPCLFWRDLFGAPGGEGKVCDLPRLAKIRTLCAKGEEELLLESPSRVALLRKGTEDDFCSGLVFLLTNEKTDVDMNIQLPRHFASRAFRCVIGDRPNVKIDEFGNARFSVGANRCSVFVPEEAAAKL